MIRKLKWLALAAGAPLLMSAADNLAVYPLPDTAWPDVGARLHTPFTLKPGEELMRAAVRRTRKLTLDAPVKVSIDRFSDEIGPGEELTPVVAPTGTSKIVGGDGLYYCGRDQRGRSALRSLLLGGIGSKFMPIVRFCFIDSDGDRKLDQVFLAGAKDKALQKTIPIAPVPYTLDYLVPRDAGQYLRLRYRKFTPESNKVQLELEIYEDGKKRAYDYVLYNGARGPLDRLYPYLEANPKKIPYPVFFNDVMGATIKVDGVDAQGNATFEILRNFRPAMFRPVSIQVQYIYIYI